MKTPKKQKADDAAKIKEALDNAPKIAELVNKSLVSLSEFLCQPSRVRYLLVIPVTRSSNKMAKWFSASFQ
jgi:hypothetical protein